MFLTIVTNVIRIREILYFWGFLDSEESRITVIGFDCVSTSQILLVVI